MKTNDTFRLLVVISVLFFTLTAKAQTPDRCGTVIEVTDGFYFDKVWLLTHPTTTFGFDNGWDGYKFLRANALFPQIYDKTVDGNFQVSTFPNIDNKYFAFLPGAATAYTFTFLQYDTKHFYSEMHLVDLLTGDTVNVIENNSKYEFTAARGDMLERFKIIAKPVVVVKPIVVTPPPVVEEPVVVAPPVVEEPVVVAPPVVEEPVVVVPVPDPIVVVDEKNKKDKKVKVNKAEQVKVTSHQKTIRFENPNRERAMIRIIDARNARVVKQVNIWGQSNESINTNLQKGQYIVQTTVEADNTSTTVLLR